MLERRVKDYVVAGYFIAVAAVMYFLLHESIYLGMEIPVRQLFVLLLIFSGFLSFLFKPNISRFVVSIKGMVVLSAPLIVMLAISLPIWIARQVSPLELKLVTWHYSIYCNQILAALVAAVFLYQFGEKGIWYNLVSLLIANLLLVGAIVAEHGVGTYLHEFVRLVVTFAAETGDVIREAELHELAFCLGAYLVYMLLNGKRKPWFFALLALVAFFFLSAFKRIAMAAILVSVVIGWMLMLMNRKGWKSGVNFLICVVCASFVVILVLYIGFVKMDGFSLLESAGVDTMTRVDLYKQFDSFYEFSPEFTGNGMGFLSYQMTRVINTWETAIHNDFLQHYIDLGFFGYIAWLLSLTALRVWYFGRHGMRSSQIMSLAMIVYMLILSSTDNTLNFQLFFTVTGILMMGEGYDERVRRTDEKMFGYIEKANRTTL